MKVILHEDLDNLGERGAIVNVSSGYARNYLLPKRLAKPATPGNIRALEQQKKSWEAREFAEIEQAREFAARLGEVELVIAKKAGESDTLYGSVTNAEIAELLHRRGFEIDRRKIQIHDPIKALGEFAVPVKLHRQVTGEVKLKVVAESESTS